jgi:hypothetical protein
MGQAWAICGIGTLICFTGVYLFHKKIFEEGKRLNISVMLMITGVILIAIGTAKYFHLIR